MRFRITFLRVAPTLGAQSWRGILVFPFPYKWVRIAGFSWFPSNRSIFSTFVGGYKNTAIAEKERKTQKSSPISKRLTRVLVNFGGNLANFGEFWWNCTLASEFGLLWLIFAWTLGSSQAKFAKCAHISVSQKGSNFEHLTTWSWQSIWPRSPSSEPDETSERPIWTKMVQFSNRSVLTIWACRPCWGHSWNWGHHASDRSEIHEAILQPEASKVHDIKASVNQWQHKVFGEQCNTHQGTSASVNAWPRPHYSDHKAKQKARTSND